MMNICTIVGKVAEIKRSDNANYIIVSVIRPFKDDKIDYERDLITCQLSKDMTENSLIYLEVGNIVAVKGWLKNVNFDTVVVVDKLTFLSNRRNEE